jgi:hypothetical protein
LGEAWAVPSDAQTVSAAEQPLLDFPKGPDNDFLRAMEKDCREKKEKGEFKLPQ